MRRRLRQEDGFTLIELLITMTIAIAVLSVVLLGFERFADSQTRATAAAGAQDIARTEVRSLVAELRQARIATGQTTPIPATWTVSRSDLVVATYVASGSASVPGWVRYCAVASSGSTFSLVRATRVGDAYMAPGTCVASGGANGWTHETVVKSRLQDPTRLFDYTSDTCSGATCLPAAVGVRSVGVRLAVSRSAGTTSLGSVVRDAVAFRNRPF